MNIRVKEHNGMNLLGSKVSIPDVKSRRIIPTSTLKATCCRITYVLTSDESETQEMYTDICPQITLNPYRFQFIRVGLESSIPYILGN